MTATKTAPRTIKIDLDKISLHDEHPVGGEVSFVAKPRRENVTLVVNGLNFAGYGLGFVPEGFQARQVDRGPLVPGPWAFAFAKAGVIDHSGGTRGELERARENGLLIESDIGDRLDIGGVLFEIRVSRNRNVALIRV